MEKNLPAPFHEKSFVDNLQPDGAIQAIRELLQTPRPCLVNIYPGEIQAADPRNPYAENSRRGGLGKSFAMREARLFLYQIRHAAGEPSSNYRANAKKKYAFIELSSQYTTKKDIICEVVRRMYLSDYKLTLDIFGQPIKDESGEKMPGENFLKVFPLEQKPNITAPQEDYDPSFRAERLFDKSVRQYLDSHEPASLSGKFVLFFDGFDEQYIGSRSAPLRSWLRDRLFPWLVAKMQCTVFVAGREKVETEKLDASLVEHFQLMPFDEEKVCKYFEIKLDETKPAKRQEVLGALYSQSQAGEKTYTPLCREIRELTNGKPIFLDFLCTLVNRFCIEEEKVSLQELIENALANLEATSDDKEEAKKKAFKKFLVGRIHLRDAASDESKDQVAAAITHLALAKHGLTPTQYAEFWYGSEAGLNFKDEIHEFFQHVFNEENLSAIVKDRDDGKEIVRLLHDEVLELVLEYYYPPIDPDFSRRNELVKYLLKMWERDELNKRDHHEFPKRLLEYVEYSFQLFNKTEEQQAINRFLFEFSYHLDRHPDLCSRLLEKANKYYVLKKEKCLRAEEQSEKDTLLFSKDYFLLSKLRMREAEYCLTERKLDWKSRVEAVTGEVRFFAERSLFPAENPEWMSWLEHQMATRLSAFVESNYVEQLSKKLHDRFSVITQEEQASLLAALAKLKSEQPKLIPDDTLQAIENWLCAKRVFLTDHQREGLEARRLSSTGEMKFWELAWEAGKKDIEQAKELFYKTGDSHGLIWAEHLLGFEAQRNGRFLEAARHHNDAIETALVHFPRLEKEIHSSQASDRFVLLYRLLFLVRTIDRAGGNLGVNLRYRGKLVDAIKVLSSTAEMANISGVREMIRILSNILQFRAIIGDFGQTQTEPAEQLREDHSSSSTHSPSSKQLVIAEQASNLAKLKPGEYKNYFSFITRMTNNPEEMYQFLEEKEHNVDDPLLPKRRSNTGVILHLKGTGSERKIYTSTKTEFQAAATHPEAVEQLDESLNRLEKEIPNKQPFLSLEPEPSEGFDILEKAADDFLTKFNVRFGREVADMYYQYGKITLSTGTTSKQGDPFDVACRVFENARFAAQKAAFLYLEMEACEALYRLSYLSDAHRSRKQEFKDWFQKVVDAINKYPQNDIGIYHDLWAKYFVTEGDFALEEALAPAFPSPASLKIAFQYYAKALYHAHEHNQNRYLLLLQVLEARVHLVFQLAHKQGELMNFSRAIAETMRASDIFNKDGTFEVFIDSLLGAAALQANPALEMIETHLKQLRDNVWDLMEKGKFIKAAAINNCLIYYYGAKTTPKPGNSLDLAYRQFQTFYCYQGANLSKKVEEFLDKTVSQWYPNLSQYATGALPKTPFQAFASLEEAIIAVALGTKSYRTGEFWNLEKFLYGELEFFRETFDLQKMENAEHLLLSAILTFLDDKVAAAAFSGFQAEKLAVEEKRRERILTEAMFRLGELYILTHAGQSKALKRERAAELAKLLFHSDILKKFKAEIEENRHEETPALLLLNCAYALAKEAGKQDQFRKEDALQSIANARYLDGETCEDDEAQRNKNIDNIIRHIHLRVRAHTAKEDSGSYAYPIVVSKAALVEGDIFFSLLFKRAGTNAYELRETWETELEKDRIELTGNLHRMMWNYLFGLNQLADKGKPYENYHFHNMMFEINRRILLIQDKYLVRVLFDDLKPVWNSFGNLVGKPELLQSLQFDIAIHEMALAANEMLSDEFFSPAKKQAA